MNVGDKVWYIGRDDSSLYINTREIYTIQEITPFDDVILKEITRSHSYDQYKFRLATTEELITYNNNKVKELCSI
jgi:hypothetical protein